MSFSIGNKFGGAALIVIGAASGFVLAIVCATFLPSSWSDAKYAVWMKVYNPYPTRAILEINQEIVRTDAALLLVENQKAKDYLSYASTNEPIFSKYFSQVSVVGSDTYNYSIEFRLKNITQDECASILAYDGLYILDNPLVRRSFYKALQGRVEYAGSCSNSSLTITIHKSGQG